MTKALDKQQQIASLSEAAGRSRQLARSPGGDRLRGRRRGPRQMLETWAAGRDAKAAVTAAPAREGQGGGRGRGSLAQIPQGAELPLFLLMFTVHRLAP